MMCGQTGSPSVADGTGGSCALCQLPCRLSGWGGTVSYYVTTMRECAALSEVRVSLPARLAPPDGQGRVVGVRVAAPANEMQVCWSLSGAARVGWLRCVRVCSLRLCPGNAPCCGGLPEEEKAWGPLLRKTPQMKRIPRRVLRARPGLGQPWLRSDAAHPTRSLWCVQWCAPLSISLLLAHVGWLVCAWLALSAGSI